MRPSSKRLAALAAIVLLLVACIPGPAPQPMTVTPPRTLAPGTQSGTAYPAPPSPAPGTIATLVSSYPGPGVPGTAYPGPSVPTATATLIPAATATPASPPTWPAIPVTPPPTVTLVMTGGPQITAFQADVSYAPPGADVRLEWQSTGGVQGLLYTVSPAGQLGKALAWTPSGAITYTIPADALEAQRFALFVVGAAGDAAQATAVVRVPCAAVWFFAAAPPQCPGGPATAGQGAEQHFEHGTMLWSGVDKRIYVLFNDPAQGYNGGPDWASFPDLYQDSQPETDPSIIPPPTFKQPKRGFGLVWRTQPGIRDRLGWATDSEMGFPMSMQADARIAGSSLYIEALHGGVWALGPSGGLWRYIP